MSKKNPAVLWSANQTGDVIGASGRQQAQKNIGITDGNGKLIDQTAANSFMTSITLDDSKELKAVFGRPTLADLTPSTANRSIGTNSSGGVEVQNLSNVTSSAETNPATGTTFVSSISQTSNGQVSYKTQNIPVATDSGTTGITPLISDLYSTSKVTGNTSAVTPDGVWDAIASLAVNNITGFGADKTLSALTETDGKISASFQSIAIGGSAVTLDKKNLAVVTDDSKQLATKDLQFLDTSASEGSSATNKFVSSVTADSTGKISVTKSNLSIATSGALGGVKSSTTGTTANRDYNVEVKNDGTMKVNVPWENNTHYASKTVVCKTNNGTSNTAVTSSETAYLNHVENGAVTSSHQILGSGVSVTSDSSGNLTLSSSMTTFTNFQSTVNVTTLNVNSATKVLSWDSTSFGFYVPPITSSSDVGKALIATGTAGNYSVEWGTPSSSGTQVEIWRSTIPGGGYAGTDVSKLTFDFGGWNQVVAKTASGQEGLGYIAPMGTENDVGKVLVYSRAGGGTAWSKNALGFADSAESTSYKHEISGGLKAGYGGYGTSVTMTKTLLEDNTIDEQAQYSESSVMFNSKYERYYRTYLTAKKLILASANENYSQVACGILVDDNDNHDQVFRLNGSGTNNYLLIDVFQPPHYSTYTPRINIVTHAGTATTTGVYTSAGVTYDSTGGQTGEYSRASMTYQNSTNNKKLTVNIDGVTVTDGTLTATFTVNGIDRWCGYKLSVGSISTEAKTISFV